MRRTRRLVGLGTVAIIAACASSTNACSDHDAGALSLCICGDHSAAATIAGATSTGAISTGAGVLSGTPRGGGGPEATQNVHVFNFDFSTNPSGMPIMDATINVGDTVHWQWDSGFHSVTSVAGSAEVYNSGDLSSPGPTFNHTFTLAGVFTYYCDIHGFDNGNGTAGGMFGTITVIQQAINSTWNVDFDGSWQTAGNWTNSAIPNGAGHVANFSGGAITGPRGVNVDAPTTVGAINFDSPSPKSFLIAGGATLSLSGASAGPASVSVVNGNHTITARLQAVSNATFNIAAASTLTATNLQTTTAALTKSGGGALTVTNIRAGALSVNGGTVTVQSNGSDTGASRVGTLTIAGGAASTATLDLNNNDLIVTSGSASLIQSQISNARHAGAWDQPGISSSSAGAAMPRNTTLGLLSGAEYRGLLGPGAQFDGFAVADNDVLVKYTWYGDTDFNGVVNFDDYSRTDSGFNNNRTGWLNGDFDANGVVNFDDYSLIDLAFNTQSGSLRRAIAFMEGSDRSNRDMQSLSLQLVQEHFARFGEAYATSFLNAVPEPASTMMLVGLAALAVGKRRRRQIS
ncbi:hypothetical protein BH09PLA1_BH09PLA1_14100 [soil metagenome]